MSDFKPGLEGVVAFETEIAEPDKEGGSLRYRGVDIEELVGHVPFGHVWGLLVDNAFNPGLPPAEPMDIPVSTGDVRVDAQSSAAALGAGHATATTDFSRLQSRYPNAVVLTFPAPPNRFVVAGKSTEVHNADRH